MTDLTSEKGIYVSTAIPLGVENFVAQIGDDIDRYGDVETFLEIHEYDEIPKEAVLNAFRETIGDVKRIFYHGGIISTLGLKTPLFGQAFLHTLKHVPADSLLNGRIERDRVVELSRLDAMDLLQEGDLFNLIKSVFDSARVTFIAPDLGTLIYPFLNTPANFPSIYRANSVYLNKFFIDIIDPRTRNKPTIDPGIPNPFVMWLSYRTFKIVFKNIRGSEDLLRAHNPSLQGTLKRLGMSMIYDIAIESGNLDQNRVRGHWEKGSKQA